MTTADLTAALVTATMLMPLALLVGAADLWALTALLGDPAWGGAIVETLAISVIGGLAAGVIGALAHRRVAGPMMPLLILGLLVPPAAIAEPSANLVAFAGLAQSVPGWLWATLSPAVAAAILVRLAAEAARLPSLPAAVTACIVGGAVVWGAALVPAAVAGAAHPPLAALALETMRQETLSDSGLAALALLLVAPALAGAVAVAWLTVRRDP